MAHSIKYPKTPSGIKRGLQAIGWSQRRGAGEIGKSPALVSMVLASKAKSQVVLDELHALIIRELRAGPRARGDAA